MLRATPGWRRMWPRRSIVLVQERRAELEAATRERLPSLVHCHSQTYYIDIVTMLVSIEE